MGFCGRRSGFLQLILSALLNLGCGVYGNPALYTLRAPLRVSVQKGLCVYVPCRFTTPPSLAPSARAYGSWIRDSSFRPIFTSQMKSHIPSSNKERILFTGDASKNDCSMSINDAQSSDAGQYYFRLDDGRRSRDFNNYKITLSIQELTATPVITVRKSLVAGEKTTLTCDSPGRCAGPAPEITWSSRRIVEKGVIINTSYLDGNRTFYSNITFTPMKEDHQSSLSCTVTFKRSSATTSKRIDLNVEFSPNVSVAVQSDPLVKYRVVPNENEVIPVMEGSSVILRCMVDSNPPAIIRWHYGDQSISGTLSGQTLTYELKNALSSNNGTYRCSAKNNRGTATRNIGISVVYAPRTPSISCSIDGGFTIHGCNSIEAKEGSSLSLQCFAESPQTATMTWTKPGKLNREPSINLISLSNIVPDNAGLYTCLATNSYGASNASVTIRVTYSPRSVPGMTSSCKELESHIECSCIIQSFPEATIQWKINEESYSSSDNDLHISTSRESQETNSTMTLQITQGNIPHIECRSSNKNGDLVLILLDKTPSSVVPIVVSVTVVVVVAVILGVGVTVLLYFRKKKLRQESQDDKEFPMTSSGPIYCNSPINCNVNDTHKGPKQDNIYENPWKEEEPAYENT